MKPTVRQLKTQRNLYPEWQICPKCMGDRGEVYRALNEETGEYHTALRTCTVCGGERVILSPSGSSLNAPN